MKQTEFDIVTEHIALIIGMCFPLALLVFMIFAVRGINRQERKFNQELRKLRD